MLTQATNSEPRMDNTNARITLVSYARGTTFEHSLEGMRNFAASFADEILLWTDEQLRADPLYQAHLARFRVLDDLSTRVKHGRHRPYCTAFKPLMMLRAISQRKSSRDYVLWADASQYHNMSLHGNVRAAVRRLDGQSAYGLVHCSERCSTENPYLSQMSLIRRSTVDAYVGLLGWSRKVRDEIYAHRGLLATNLLWASTDANRRLAEMWLQMALRSPRAFCDSHTQDQAALTILAVNLSLSMLDPCLRMGLAERQGAQWPNGKCFDQEKNLDFMLDAIATGAYDVRVA